MLKITLNRSTKKLMLAPSLCALLGLNACGLPSSDNAKTPNSKTADTPAAASETKPTTPDLTDKKALDAKKMTLRRNIQLKREILARTVGLLNLKDSLANAQDGRATGIEKQSASITPTPQVSGGGSDGPAIVSTLISIGAEKRTATKSANQAQDNLEGLAAQKQSQTDGTFEDVETLRQKIADLQKEIEDMTAELNALSLIKIT